MRRSASSSRSQIRLALPALLTSLAAAACATSAHQPLTPVDLSTARANVEQAGAGPDEGQSAKACLALARRVLDQAEALAASQDPQERELASWLGSVAIEAAGMAAECGRPSPSSPDTPETRRLAAELRRAHEAQRGLEERLSVLQRELQLMETEIIRTKARLGGLQTKAEAAAAVAEAKILVRRAAKERGPSSTIARCRDLVKRAEQQLRDGNYGAAVFFAGGAQDLAAGRRRDP